MDFLYDAVTEVVSTTIQHGRTANLIATMVSMKLVGQMNFGAMVVNVHRKVQLEMYAKGQVLLQH